LGCQEIFPESAAPSKNARTGIVSPPGVFEHGSGYLVFHGYALPSCTIIKRSINSSFSFGVIVGQLLLLSPEEDVFWIFVSIMDTHIWPYFSASTTQIEVDAALFSRALEANDPQFARKVFVDTGVLSTRMNVYVLV
jgi:hypothetical protein